MKAIILFLIIIGALVSGFIYLNNQAAFYTYNNYLNDLVKNKPKIICTSDEECHIAAPDCSPCACGIAANVDWQPFCPFKKPVVACSPCPYVGKIKCVDTQCQLVTENF